MSALKPIFHDYAWPASTPVFEKYATLHEALTDLFVGEPDTAYTRAAIDAFALA